MSSDGHNDGGFAAHMSTRWHDSAATYSGMQHSLKSTGSHEEIDYENLHPTRAPVALPPDPQQSSRHPFVQPQNPAMTSSAGEFDAAPIFPDHIELHPSSDGHCNTNSNNIVTLTGTIKRGKKDTVEIVQLQLTPEQLEKMNRSTITIDDADDTSKCGLRKGLHILLLTLLFFPLAFISSLCVCFYVGTMCWYNIYLYLSEEKSLVHQIFLCPLLILSYPVLIVLLSVGLACYASVRQISWFLSSWLRQVRDFDKGLFGWLCQKLGVPQCAPYEVVILDDAALGQVGMASSFTEASV